MKAFVLPQLGFLFLAALTCPGAARAQPAGCAVETPLHLLECKPDAGCASTLCTGLGALLHFDNDSTHGETATLVHDYSINEHGAICSAPNCPVWVPDGGHFGGAFSYSEPQAFFIPDAPSVSFTGSVTQAAWFYPTSLLPGWRIVITKIQTSPFGANYGLPHNGATFCVNFNVGGTWQNHCSAATFTPGRWYHLVGVIDAVAGRAQVYVDGVRVVDDVETVPIQPDTGHVWIGWSPTNGGVAGLIDEVAIWNRALSPAEILALFGEAAGAPDAGATDAGAVDSGTADSGSTDAGVPAQPDAIPRTMRVGCGCGSGAGGMTLAAVFLVLAVLRRARYLRGCAQLTR